MSQPTQRLRAPVAVKRDIDENVDSSKPQKVVFAKEIALAATNRGKTNVIGATMISRKRVFGQPTTNAVITDKENASDAGGSSKPVLAPVRQETGETTAARPVAGNGVVAKAAPIKAAPALKAPGAPLRNRPVLQPVPTQTIKAKMPVPMPVPAPAAAAVTVSAPVRPVLQERVPVNRFEKGIQDKAPHKVKIEISRQQRYDEFVERLKKARHEEEEAEEEESEPWDDLDEEDLGDPLMVAEYVNDIFDNMREQERALMPKPDYMSTQRELSWSMRKTLVDWLVEIHHKFKLLPETLFLSVNIVDRFLSLRGVSLMKLQLVGVTTLFIASKYEEMVAPSVTNFVYMTGGAFSEKEILHAERYVLQVLQFQLNFPSPLNFLRRISKADNYDIHSRTVAKYLMEVPILDERMLCYPPSQIAAAALCLARQMLGNDDWHGNLVHYSGYTYAQLEPCLIKMQIFLTQVDKSLFVYRKYSTKRYMKASVYVRSWLRMNSRNSTV
ncbi:G2/mitotic-specific cyclin [Podila epigama]|nr:G2/mitotic-specific cyclin [Podila epigama]